MFLLDITTSLMMFPASKSFMLAAFALGSFWCMKIESAITSPMPAPNNTKPLRSSFKDDFLGMLIISIQFQSVDLVCRRFLDLLRYSSYQNLALR